MSFVPTQKQVDSLFLILTQLVRENIEIRLIRFNKWAEGIGNCEIEVICYEDEDRYIISFNGMIEERFKRRR